MNGEQKHTAEPWEIIAELSGKLKQAEADRDRLQAELDKARAGEQNNADLAQHYFKELTQRTADRDRWKALAVEVGLQLENVRDYAIECQNNVLDDGRERYVRQKKLIQDDIDALDLAMKKLQEAQDEGN